MAQDVVNQALVGFGQHVLMEPSKLFGSHLGIEDDNGSVRVSQGKPVITFEQERLRPAGKRGKRTGNESQVCPKVLKLETPSTNVKSNVRSPQRKRQYINEYIAFFVK